MDIFFNPRSVAVAGASQKPNLGNFVVQNLKKGFDGQIIPLNPNYDTIEDLACYPSLEKVPGPVDLLIVLIPAPGVPDLLKACAAKKVGHVIIESAGFDESGDEGRALQKECNTIAQNAGIRLWGPNCMGLVDAQQDHYFTFMHPKIRAEGLKPGHISLIVQSGMMSAIFLVELAKKGIGIAKACSIGNRADVNECDLLEYLEQDTDTHVIAMYLESFINAPRLTKLIEKTTKPVLLLKGGQSKAGAVAAMSHTSSLAGNSRLGTSILANQGVFMADSIFQMADMANTLVHIPQIDPACRIAIMTLSGGAGILACDALEKKGLPVSELSPKTKERLKDIFPPWMPPSNPVDMFPAVALRGRQVAFVGCLEALLADENLDVLIIHIVVGLEPFTMPLDDLKKQADDCDKTIVFWLMGTKQGKEKFETNARDAGFLVFSDITTIAHCLDVAAQRQRRCMQISQTKTDLKKSPVASEIIVPEISFPSGQTVADEFESKHLLSQIGIPVVPEATVQDLEAAKSFAGQHEFPLVLKGLVPEMTHKTELGLVRLNITDEKILEHEFNALKSGMPETGQVLIQKQLASDYELIAGYILDAQFGPCVMFGLGGILAELEPDVSFSTAPESISQAIKLIQSLRNYRLISGYRNLARLDEEYMADILIKLGKLGAASSRIQQIDINPLVVHKGKPAAVDAGIILTP